MKSVAALSPLLLCLLAGTAQADLEPYSFGASETVHHDSNVLRDAGSGTASDWFSITEFNAALDQAIGRDELKATASFDVNRYRKLHDRNSEGYSANAEFDWSTVGDISGAFGANSQRHQYLYGFDGDQPSGLKNLQTDNHAFARAQLGGIGRWSIFTGFDVSQRRYSDPTFDSDEEQQWAINGGTSYQTSPDLSFGIQGRYVQGKYPNVILAGSAQAFTLRTISLTTKWKASGNSSFDANIGYSQQHTDAQPAENFASGGLNWVWAPPSHFNVKLSLSRDSSIGSGVDGAVVNANSSTGRSINNTVNLDVTYELTAKINLDAGAQYIERKYSDALSVTSATGFASGATRASRFSMSAHYVPTRTTDLSCGYTRERLSSDQSIALVSPAYTNNGVMCTAAIHFD